MSEKFNVIMSIKPGLPEKLLDESMWKRLHEIANIEQHTEITDFSDPAALERMKDADYLWYGWEAPHRDWYAKFWQYIDEHLVDHEKGSWFHQLEKDNTVLDTVWPGKSDLYHATQCTLIPLLDPAVSVAPAFKAAKEA
ncbi:hypothetical protein EMO89_08980 [Bifidobacterium tissieri]|uniref:Uncharacterized protein n=1 Tax=Bifidobacterium tissieri TaxID=1630162 RepID=A0A5M9ZM66_9BIFI|nr:hypothetical protein EMO89_08980 [Bifidobacterium tissieri]KAA8833363.1 hypothetical protein EM849_01445 [Bifidobacterium tissieri]